MLALINCISSERLSQHFQFVKNSKYKSHVSYYGFHLLFRIEMELSKAEIKSYIKAYSLSYDVEPKEVFLGVAYEFDSLGNINRRWTPDEFAQYFISDVYEKILTSQPIHLKPE